ncbi:MAG: ISL3 family transposase, partial [bacterium]|nr:ISL3 family transposase [bacterium]
MHTIALFQAALGLTRPWIVSQVEFSPDDASGSSQLDMHLDFPRGSRFPCPQCDQPCPAHDTVSKTWRHLDFFQHEAHLHARVPRVRCSEHGVLLAAVPWARSGSGFTLLFEAYVMLLSEQLPVAALGRFVRATDKRLWRVLDWHVADARERVDMAQVSELVVDETARARGQTYVSLFVEPSQPKTDDAPARKARVLFVADGRKSGTFRAFEADLVRHGGAAKNVTDVCMDMSAAFQKGASETIPWAKVTFDRFHVIKLANEALDDVRRREVKGSPELKGTRYSWLRNPQDLTDSRFEELERLSETNLLTARAYHMRLNLQDVWKSKSATTARRRLKKWCKWVRRVARRPTDPSEPWILEKMHTLAQTVTDSTDGILNYFRRRQTSGVIEGMNSLVQAARSRARGYRNPETYKTIIYLIA